MSIERGPSPKEMGTKTESRTVELLKEKALGELQFAPNAEQMRWFQLKEQDVANIDTMIKAVGSKFVEERLSSVTTGEDLARTKERLEDIGENMTKGAFAKLDGGDAGPTGGYYGGYDKENKLNIEAVDIERWAKKAAYKETVTLEEQADLLRGFFATELAQGMIDKVRFRGAGAFETLGLIARVEGKKPQEIAVGLSGLFKQLREKSEDKKSFDKAVSKVNLLWDEKFSEYVKI